MVALAIGLGIGAQVPELSHYFGIATTPALVFLIFVTCMGIPFEHLCQAWRDKKFITLLVVINFICAPGVAWVVTHLLEGSPDILVGALLVLLAPCVDYVVVFTRLSGGASERLLAAAPLTMLMQMVTIPIYLGLFIQTDMFSAMNVVPFVRAFILFIALPLLISVVVQKLIPRYRIAGRVKTASEQVMVILMIITLFLIAASQASLIFENSFILGRLVVVYVAFALVMVLIGVYITRFAKMKTPEQLALVFSGITRNSLVVLPIALSMANQFTLAPLAVIVQTVVELFIMVVSVRVLPRVVLSAKPSYKRFK